MSPPLSAVSASLEPLASKVTAWPVAAGFGVPVAAADGALLVTVTSTVSVALAPCGSVTVSLAL